MAGGSIGETWGIIAPAPNLANGENIFNAGGCASCHATVAQVSACTSLAAPDEYSHTVGSCPCGHVNTLQSGPL